MLKWTLCGPCLQCRHGISAITGAVGPENRSFSGPGLLLCIHSSANSFDLKFNCRPFSITNRLAQNFRALQPRQIEVACKVFDELMNCHTVPPPQRNAIQFHAQACGGEAGQEQFVIPSSSAGPFGERLLSRQADCLPCDGILRFVLLRYQHVSPFGMPQPGRVWDSSLLTLKRRPRSRPLRVSGIISRTMCELSFVEWRKFACCYE